MRTKRRNGFFSAGKPKKKKTVKKKSQKGGAEENAENGHQTVTIKGYLQVGVGNIHSFQDLNQIDQGLEKKHLYDPILVCF